MYKNYNIVDGKRQTVMLDGNTVLTHENIVGLARISNPQISSDDDISNRNWIRFEIPFELLEGQTIDNEILENYGYNVAIVLASSIQGAYFTGAVGSTLYIDTLEIECED